MAVGGRQISLHASMPLSREPAVTHCGPLKLDIVDPMRVLRAHGEAEGVAYDIEFRAETGAIDEGRLVLERDRMTFIDQTRFMQYGSWHGWIQVDGIGYKIDGSDCFGLRDKSWGVRLFAENHTTAEKGGQIFCMNLVTRLEENFSVIRVLNDADGVSRERTGYLAPLYSDPGAVPIGETALSEVKDWSFDLDFAGGTRRIAAGAYTLEMAMAVSGTGNGGGPFLFMPEIGYQPSRLNHGLART